MTYQLQYYKNLTHGDHTVRLNIYRKTEDDATPLFPTPLGDVIEGLEYGIQGRDGDFAPAIQKTSLTLTLVDAPEKNSVAQKWGGWEEFYTPDATMFRVDLLIDGALEWSGYVTPDSYEEDLTYHSAISITARDNWGRLNDFEFDHKGDEFGMISILDLVLAAAEKAGVAMPVILNTRAPWAQCDGVPLYDHLVNVKAFEDGKWWDAVADTLEGVGMTLTFKGGAEFDLAPVRGVTLKGQGTQDTVQLDGFIFEAPGHRSLAPAVREIVEKADFEISEDMLNARPMTLSSFVAGAGYPYTTQPYGVTETTMPVFMLSSEEFWKDGEGVYCSLLNTFNYSSVEGDDDVRLHDGHTLYLATNPGTITDYATAYRSMKGVFARVPMTLMKGKVQFSCGAAVRMYDGKMFVGTAPVMENYVSPLIQDVIAKVYYTTDDGTVYYYDGAAWVEGPAQFAVMRPEEASYTCDFEIPSLDLEASGILTIGFICGHYIVRGEYDQEQAGDGMYMPITGIKVVPTRAQRATDKTTTKYIETNNVTLSRAPQIAALNFDTAAPAEVINGIYSPLPGRPAAREWGYGDRTTKLAALIHQQLLCWHARPMNVLTGTLIVNRLKSYPSFRGCWTWKDREFLLTDGRVDLLSGRMRNAQLREFLRYDDLWGEVADQYLDSTGRRLYDANNNALIL